MSSIASSQLRRWHPHADAAALQDAVATRVAAAAAAAISTRGAFRIVLAGGTTPRGMYERLREAPMRSAPWDAWQVYFGDERCAPPDDDERNSRMAAVAWLDHVPIPGAQRHAIPAELGPVEAARRYAATLADVDVFDLVLLGLGEDGHTGSLFPGRDAGTDPASPAVLAVFDAPKPPPERVSLAAWRFARAREVIFMVAGAGKREAVSRWRAGEPIPASRVVPPGGVDIHVEAGLLDAM